MNMQFASKAISRNLILVVNNLNEFQRIKNLKIESWV